MATASMSHNLSHVESGLDRVEALICQASIPSLHDAIAGLEAVRVAAGQVEPPPPGAPESAEWMSRMAQIRQRLARMVQLLDGAARFYGGWAEQVAAESGYQSDGRTGGLATVRSISDGPRLRAHG